MPSEALNSYFILKTPKSELPEKQKQHFAVDQGKRSPQEQQITKRGVCFLFPPNWAQSLVCRRCLAQNKLLPLGAVRWHLAERRPVAASSTAKVPTQRLPSRAVPAPVPAQPGAAQVRLHGAAQDARRLLSAFSVWLCERSRAPAGSVRSVPPRRNPCGNRRWLRCTG